MKLTKDDKAFLAEKYRTVWPNDDRMVDHCVKTTSAYVTLDDGTVLTHDKERIQTQFWFGEHGFDYDEKVKLAHELSEDESYFYEENMRRCDANYKLGRIADGRYETWVGRAYCGSDAIVCLRFYSPWEDDKEGRELSDDEKARVVSMLEGEQEKFGKRLTSYLKRYGLSKCRFDTFWADR